MINVREFKANCFFLLFQNVLRNSQSYIRRWWWGREGEGEGEGKGRKEGDGLTLTDCVKGKVLSLSLSL